MHYIQSHILDKLVYAHYLRNRDMRPPNVESNLYQYHLQQLQKEGFVEKTEQGYRLSARGLAYADRHSTTLKKTRSQPKLITTLFVVNGKGQLHLRPKMRQPFKETLSLPSGKIHLDETIAEAAQREFHEKVNNELSIGNLEHIGTAHFTIRQSDFVISDYIALLIKVPIAEENVHEPMDFYTISELRDEQLTPSVRELIAAYQTGAVFSEATIDISAQ